MPSAQSRTCSTAPRSGPATSCLNVDPKADPRGREAEGPGEAGRRSSRTSSAARSPSPRRRTSTRRTPPTQGEPSAATWLLPAQQRVHPGFADAAFTLKKGTILRPGRDRAYGYHLIQVTDRKEGGSRSTSSSKEPVVQHMYAVDRCRTGSWPPSGRTAKIEIKPMPADLVALLRRPPRSHAPAHRPAGGRPPAARRPRPRSAVAGLVPSDRPPGRSRRVQPAPRAQDVSVSAFPQVGQVEAALLPEGSTNRR